MSIPIIVVAIMAGVAVAAIIIAFATISHATNLKNIESGNTWLFENWEIQVYDTLFTNKDPADIGKTIGVDVPKYMHNCKLIRQGEQLKKVIIDKLCGFVIIAISGVSTLLTLNMLIVLIGLLVAVPFIALPVYMTEKTAEKRRFTIADELPRFLDMLHSALIIGMPINQAIEITARSLDGTILADELLQTLAATQVGAYSWQVALEKLADDYQVDTFTDFVLDITNAYNHGSSIQHSVARMSENIKNTNLTTMKARASKMTNTILFPILIFKIVPIIAIMAIPIILQLQASGF